MSRTDTVCAVLFSVTGVEESSVRVMSRILTHPRRAEAFITLKHFSTPLPGARTAFYIERADLLIMLQIQACGFFCMQFVQKGCERQITFSDLG